jgi:S1-C subfamily serine protease
LPFSLQVTLGPLELAGVMVEEDNGVGNMILGDRHLATWGMAALRRVRRIVDGSRGVAYIQPLHGLAPTPEHNRLGAVFVPNDAEEDAWIAHVAKGSPAFEAGIRSGDVLLRSGDHDFSGWRATPVEVSSSGGADPPPGTEVELTLRRGQHVYTTTVVLRDILNPSRPDGEFEPE